MRAPPLVGLLVASAALAGRADETLDVVRAEEGYRIARPDARWAVRELPAPAGVHHAMKLELAPAPAEVSLTVYAADAPSASTAESLCAANASKWKERSVGDVARDKLPLAGGEASSLTCDVLAFGTTIRIRQIYVMRENDVLLVQCMAPAKSYGEHEKEFAAALATLSFLPSDPARATSKKLRALAALCGSEVPRAATWAAAAARATREKRLVLVVFEEYGGLPIVPRSDATTFMDDDVVALVKERFVVLAWRGGLGAPFDRPDVYGFGPHTFGEGVVFATAEGRVVGSVGLLEPSFVDDAARAALAACPEAGGAAADPLDAAAALRRGELDRAATLLAKPAKADDLLLRAALMRRLRRADDALAALDSAAAAGADEKTVATERGLVLLRAGRIDEATVSFLAAGDVPAARYWLCVTHALRVGVGPVRAELTALATSASAGRWGRRAAALSLGRGVATGVEAVVWPDAAVREAAAPRPSAPTADAARAEADAVSYLLLAQRPDGTWPVPMAFTHDPTAPMTLAVTSIAGAALLRERGRPAVDAAVRNARDAVMRGRGRLVAAGGGLFDHSVWAQIFSLRFLALCAKDAPAADAARVKGLAGDIVAAMARTQAPGGGWSYVRLEDAGASADNSISFVTAAALLALADARDAGVAVPDDLVRRAADVVESLRREDGSWSYQTATPGASEPTEAALRGPLCALALRRVGRAKDTGAIERALAALVAQRDVGLKQAGKSLCHTAPDATSAYYLLFGLRFAAEAAAELPAEASAPARRALREAALSLRRDDGSFCDFPPVGPAYGTSMALETLARAR